MRFLQISTTNVSSKSIKLGLPVTEDDIIDSITYISLDHICYIKENPDNKNLIIIGCSNGIELTSDYSLSSIAKILGLKSD